MPDQPTPEEISRFERWFAVYCNNQTWDLLSKDGRTPEEDQEMLYIAFAAAYHWSKAGNALNWARADVTLATVLAVLGRGSEALFYARRCLDFFQNNQAPDWDIAFAHATLSLAAAVAGESALHAEHYALALEAGNAIQDKEDREVFFAEFARVPEPV